MHKSRGAHIKNFLILWDKNVFNVWSLYKVQELCESRGGRPGLSVLLSLTVSVDVKQHWTVLRHWSQFVPNMSANIRGQEALHHHHDIFVMASNKGELCQCMSHCSCTSLKCGIRFSKWGCLVLLYFNWWCLCFGVEMSIQAKFYCKKCMLAHEQVSFLLVSDKTKQRELILRLKCLAIWWLTAS